LLSRLHRRAAIDRKIDTEESAKCDEVESFATFPLIDVLPDVAKLVWPMILPFFREKVEEIGLFAGIRKQLDRNFHDASGVRIPGAKS
jgi:hypothetical protein